MPEGSSFALVAKTASGKIAVDFPLTPSAQAHNRVKGQTDASPKASLEAKAASGSIHIRKRV
jgi:DUF4097 and DUF4098 domain-containing protein YvlB